MAKVLGQLQCGRCGRRFWPTCADWTLTTVYCPYCEAAHANPMAAADRPQARFGEMLDSWLDRFWIGAFPSQGAWGIRALRVGELGFPFASFVRTKKGGLMGGVVTLVAVHDVRAIDEPDVIAGHRVWRTSAGIWWEDEYDRGDEKLEAITSALRSRGFEPPLALNEVDDPEPLTTGEPESYAPADEARDSYVHTLSVACDTCGARLGAGALVGGDARCCYCGVPQKLVGDLAREQGPYRNRARSMQLHAPRVSLSHWARAATPPGQGLLRGCLRCGAMNRGDTECSSCRAPAKIASRPLGSETGSSSSHGHESMGQLRALLRARRRALIAGGASLSAFYLLVMGAVVFYALVLGWERSTLAGVVVLMCGLALLAALTVPLALAAYLRTRKEVSRWSPLYAALAEQLDAVPMDLVEWSERWWDDRLRRRWLAKGPARRTLALAAAGYPTAVTADIDPEPDGPLVAMSNEPHAVVLLAAALPRDVAYRAKHGQAFEGIAALKRAGFHVELRTGGLALLASDVTIARIRREPERLAMLGPVVYALARLAHQLRADQPKTSGSARTVGAAGQLEWALG
jgi:hypothetical protein